MSDNLIWVRSIKYHSYHNRLREPDTFYTVDNPEDLETILAQQVAVRDSPPSHAKRPEATTHEAQRIAAQLVGHPIGPMGTATWPTPSATSATPTAASLPARKPRK